MERDTEQLLDQCRRTNKRLLEQLDNLNKRVDACYADVKHHRMGAELTAKALLDTNRELDRIRQDNEQILQFNSAKWLYDELVRERSKVATLKERHARWASLTRRATFAKAEEAQRARELDRLVEELRQKLVETERQRDAAVEQAEKVIADQKAKLDRIEEQCRLWKRGERGTMTTIAGISGEFSGRPLPEPGAWDRMRALQEAQTLSLMNEATDRLGAIEALLEAEGVGLVSTQVKQVKDYIDLMKGRIKAAEEGEGDKCQE